MPYDFFYFLENRASDSKAIAILGLDSSIDTWQDDKVIPMQRRSFLSTVGALLATFTVRLNRPTPSTQDASAGDWSREHFRKRRYIWHHVQLEGQPKRFVATHYMAESVDA